MRRIGGQYQVELYGNVRCERLGGDNGAAEIELLEGREDEMNCRAIGQRNQLSGCLDDDGAASAIVNRGPREPFACQLNRLRCIDDRRPNIDFSGQRFLGV